MREACVSQARTMVTQMSEVVKTAISRIGVCLLEARRMPDPMTLILTRQNSNRHAPRTAGWSDIAFSE